MSELATTRGGLDEYRDLYREVAQQIYKDFVTCGASIRFPESGGPRPEETLYDTVLPVVQELLASNRNQLMKLIYRVDIPEAQLGRALENAGAEESGRLLARMIVRREIQKIEIRRAHR